MHTTAYACVSGSVNEPVGYQLILYPLLTLLLDVTGPLLYLAAFMTCSSIIYWILHRKDGVAVRKAKIVLITSILSGGAFFLYWVLMSFLQSVSSTC